MKSIYFRNIMSLFSFALFVISLMSIVNAGEKVCPGYGYIRTPENCESTCSIEKDECPRGKKCCFRAEQPCGFQCIVPKDNEQKQGQCPSSSSGNISDSNWNLCDGHMCDVDNDCQGTKKCCSNRCSSFVCIKPE